MFWLKDGQRVIRAEEGSQHGGGRLTVTSVQREDQGMYQCVASSDGESVQAVAELRLGGEYKLHVYQRGEYIHTAGRPQGAV
jgi:uncharacterized protein YodC (DUF2158 family)